jgi:phosphatidylserine decarboxylase
MPSLDKHDSPLPTTTVKWRFPAVHPEGRKFAVGAGAITVLAFLFHWGFLGWILAGLTIWVAAFFRDPVRTTPRGDRLVVAPADGLVTMIAKVGPPPELRGSDGLADSDYTRVSIFMSVFDVHINRAPCAGTVEVVAYRPGKFLNAAADKASDENERMAIALRRADGNLIGFVQIAGWVARRIVCYVKPGQAIVAGERFGHIRFGSRTDLYLPSGARLLVAPGQRMIGGETVMAELTPAVASPRAAIEF